MTKNLIAIASDIHVEFEANRGPDRPSAAWYALRDMRRTTPGHPPVGPDLTQAKAAGVKLVLMAGDVGVGARQVMAYSRAVSEYLDGAAVVVVPGNHEAYGHDLERVIAEMRDLSGLMPGSEIWALENERLDIEVAGQPIIVLGCTLWTDYALYGADKVDASIIEAVGSLNDHVRIRLRGNEFHPFHALQLHTVSRKWLARELARARRETPDVPVLVVTHHAPTPEAIPPQYRGGLLSAAFASDLVDEIAGGELQGAALWVCGHTHHCFQQQVGRTLVMASQRGYVGHETGADNYLPAIIDLEDLTNGR